MKILIIEDEELAAKRMIQLVLDLEPEAEIFGPLDTVVSSVAHLKTRPGYDLIFLDIQLADGRSFSIFESVKVDTPVIFTTAYDEFALKAFDLNSIDYLLKPVNRDKLQAALEKYKKLKVYFGDQINQRLYEMLNSIRPPEVRTFKDRFLVSRADTLIPVKAKEIACFYAEDKAVLMQCIDGKKHVIPHTLDELEEKLDPKLFFRASRQCIIALHAIIRISNYFGFKLKIEIQPDPGMDIIISRARVSEFKQWMGA